MPRELQIEGWGWWQRARTRALLGCRGRRLQPLQQVPLQQAPAQGTPARLQQQRRPHQPLSRRRLRRELRGRWGSEARRVRPCRPRLPASTLRQACRTRCHRRCMAWRRWQLASLRLTCGGPGACGAACRTLLQRQALLLPQGCCRRADTDLPLRWQARRQGRRGAPAGLKLPPRSSAACGLAGTGAGCSACF